MTYQAGDVPISEAWLRVIAFCNKRLRYGELSVRIVNAQPTVLIHAKEEIRFDKPLTEGNAGEIG